MIPCPFTQHSNRPALITERGTLSYSDLGKAVSALTIALKKMGIKAGTKVPFISENTPECIALFFALFRLGAIACPLSHRHPPSQIDALLNLLGAPHLFKPPPLHFAENNTPANLSLDALATFLATSGSSGKPKIACHTLGNHIANARTAVAFLHLSETSTWRLSLPLFHVSGIGILFRCFLSGASVLLTDQIAPTHLSLVPTQLFRQKDTLPKTLTCILLGGAPIPSSLLTADLPLFTTYGMTEMSSMITLNGKLLPERQLKIGPDGEIYVRGKTLFQGYWNGQEIEQVGEWFATRDLGAYDMQGHLQILGRKDRLFISGGENIQPEEIEKALLSLPGIQMATVLPIEDPEFGKRPVAFIDDTTGTYTIERIREALRSHLEGFKLPICILPYPSHPAGLKPQIQDLAAHLMRLPL
ncbi:MAG: AMP-binding protein [Verrucomicrobia bacterium]|nr:AMP-binding protein [Verrucomicrobiota bacterium]